ncbi:Protein LEAD-SENSITIVE 1 [Linum perenne]
MGVLSNKLPREELKPGDHIYSWRHGFVYSHHGIYIGDGTVIHFTPGQGQEIGTNTHLNRYMFSSCPPPLTTDEPCPNCPDEHLNQRPGVSTICLDCFLMAGELYRFEYNVSLSFFLAKVRGGTCTLAPSDPPEQVLRRARALWRTNGFGEYSVLSNNCEAFAVYCKTGLRIIGGMGRSGQVDSLFAAAALVVDRVRYLSAGNLSVMGVAVGVGTYHYTRYCSDIGVRRDVAKVPLEELVGDGCEIE